MKYAVAGTADLGETAAKLRERHGELWDSGKGYAKQEHSDLALRTNRVGGSKPAETGRQRPRRR